MNKHTSNNSTLVLVPPSREMEQAILAYRQAFLDQGEPRINGSCGLHGFADFDSWFQVVDALVSRQLSRDGVHASTFFSIQPGDGHIIGSVQLRHWLTPELLEHGGHIGYAIHPQKRGRGYGHLQLQLVLDKAREMGIPQVMVSCDSDNLASIATIRSCGGWLEKQNMHQGQAQNIYWIATSG